jgi:hypothetical protein
MYRPLLLIDIDGVISLFGFEAHERPAGRFVSVDGIPHLLSDGAATELHRLTDAFELVWCSGWEEKADEYLPHALGLPSGLPHLSFPTVPGDAGRHWKLSAIDVYAGPDRPLAWIDDGHDATCHAWAVERPGPTLLVATDPVSGLTPVHTVALLEWARGLTDA